MQINRPIHAGSIWRCIWLLPVIVFGTVRFQSSPVRAQAEPATATGSTVEVREWVILECDPSLSHANPQETVGSTLPESLLSLRAAETEQKNEPSPVGVIRFMGHSNQKFAVHLTIPETGVFYASWPLAHMRGNRAVWYDLTIGATPQRLIPLDNSHWLYPLRNIDGPYITSISRSEKFLLYDATFPFTLPLGIAEGNTKSDSVRIRNTGPTLLHDLVIYRPTRDGTGWATASLAEVPPESSGTPTTAPAERPVVQFAPVDNDPSHSLNADWTARLADWELDPAELNLILKILRSNVLKSPEMTAIFRLDDAAINRLLPLEISPRPARIRRLAIVIARHVDPQMPQLLDQLIAQLGDADWHKREAASSQLARFGTGANPKLREATRSSDPEVVLRAERLLSHNSARY